jgi:hypothetical protein
VFENSLLELGSSFEFYRIDFIKQDKKTYETEEWGMFDWTTPQKKPIRLDGLSHYLFFY